MGPTVDKRTMRTAQEITILPGDLDARIKFEHYLKSLNIAFTTDDYYIHVGNPAIGQGWILHLSILPTLMNDLLEIVVPELIKYPCAFKVVRDDSIYRKMNSGDYGKFKVGKAVTIYLGDQSRILELAELLLLLTGHLKGPQVFTDFPLGGIVYTRYGSFINRIETDPYGYRFRVMEDAVGRLLLDRYYSPPRIPPGVANPFQPIVDRLPKQGKKVFLLAGKYMPVKLLKSDSKGDVWKALYLNRFFLPRWCVVKQARQGMFWDEEGRDIQKRLDWQYEVNQDLQGKIQLPSIFDKLTEYDHTFLIMDYVKNGTDLVRLIYKEMDKLTWTEQPTSKKRKILNYYLQVVKIIDTLHKNGYVHRDITGTNFLVTKAGKVVAIDLELVYSVNNHLPCPPFGGGTPGYMADEQGFQAPTLKEDIYALGALLSTILFGGITPDYIIDGNRPLFRERADFIVDDQEMVDMIEQCLVQDPISRPTTEGIINKIEVFIKRMGSVNSDRVNRLDQPDPLFVKILIEKGINALSGDMMSSHNLWHARVENEYGIDVYPLFDRHTFFNLYDGLSGVLWTLFKLKSAGFDISRAYDKIGQAMSHLDQYVFPKIQSIPSSLFYGKTGLSVMLAAAIESDIIDNDERISSIMYTGLHNPSQTLEIVNGISGQVIAIWQCWRFFPENLLKGMLIEYLNKILQEQKPDGSWLFTENGEQEGSIKTGFGHGMAGVIYVLMESAGRLAEGKYWAAAEKGLKYLTKKKRDKKNYTIWHNSNTTKEAGTWWCNGSPGIALTYLKAFEITKHVPYLRIADRALRVYPKHLLTSKLSMCHGIAGLGSIYQEAYRVTGNPEWQERANWLANVTIKFRREQNISETYWMVDKNDFPVAGLMLGNAGMLHFLAGFATQNHFPFPLL